MRVTTDVAKQFGGLASNPAVDGLEHHLALPLELSFEANLESGSTCRFNSSAAGDISRPVTLKRAA
jgi:hypothetical protein